MKKDLVKRLLSPDATVRQEAEAEHRNATLEAESNAKVFGLRLRIENGQDGADILPGLSGRPGGSYHFDIAFNGKVVGSGSCFWFSYEGSRPMRTLDWHMKLLPDWEDSPCLSELLWFKLGLDAQLPAEFQVGYEHSEKEIKEWDSAECG